ncbi:MAG: FkbM family methyltransferase [Spirochaetes bacterium]|nr:FkbM family methyltransferase [Spirochaetota bacterium]
MKYDKYKSIGHGEGMSLFIGWLNANTTMKITNIFEIGANFAQDADYLAFRLKVQSQNVYVFEAHPELYKAIVSLHNFNAYNYACFNEEKELEFHIVPIDSENSGISSIFKSTYQKIAMDKVSVKAIRMDNFMNKNNIDKIDFLKLDVEGATYEVLEGFGERIKDIQVMHIEAEHEKGLFDGMKYYFDDIAQFLIKHNFEMVYFQRTFGQSDSFWVKKGLMK